MAAALLETGIDYFAVNKRHFRTKSKKRIALETELLGHMRFFHEGRGVFMSVSRALMERLVRATWEELPFPKPKKKKEKSAKA